MTFNNKKEKIVSKFTLGSFDENNGWRKLKSHKSDLINYKKGMRPHSLIHVILISKIKFGELLELKSLGTKTLREENSFSGDTNPP